MNLKQESTLEKLKYILENRTSTGKPSTPSISDYIASLEKQIADSVAYLDSDRALKSMEIDPYWPKWNSPWWHMTLLYEMGLAERIPYRALELFEKALDGYLHFFPATDAEVPEGRDPIADIVCQCALGTAHRVFLSANIEIDQKQPWIREWFVKYQLADGGYNCDEAAYAKPNGKSSMISTIHIIESILDHVPHGISDQERKCLDRSIDYLLQRKLLRSLSKGNQIIDSNWTLLTFPRFYEIDILRALQCVLRWAVFFDQKIPYSSIEEVVNLIDEKLDAAGSLHIEREFYSSIKTRIRNADGTWQRNQPVTVFPLLIAVGENERVSPFLTSEWNKALDNLKQLDEKNLLSLD